jgi:hypothetical protein
VKPFTAWLLKKAGRNLAEMRLQFLAADLAIWAGSVCIALCAT